MKLVDKIGMVLSACCAIHCALTPLLLLILPAMHMIPDKWHDAFIFSTVALALVLTLRNIGRTKLPFLISILGLSFALLAHLRFETFFDILVGISLSAAHWFNHSVKKCSHSHEVAE